MEGIASTSSYWASASTSTNLAGQLELEIAQVDIKLNYPAHTCVTVTSSYIQSRLCYLLREPRR
jgi:hypothetical protein